MNKPIEELLAEANQRLERIEHLTLIQSKEMLTIGEVALLMNTCKQHIYRLTRNNKIPYYKPNGKVLYFNKKEITDWLRRNRVAAKEETEQN